MLASIWFFGDTCMMKSSLYLAHIESFRRPLGWNWVSHLLLQSVPFSLKGLMVSQPWIPWCPSRGKLGWEATESFVKLPLERPHVHVDVLKTLSNASLRCLQLSSFAPQGAAVFNKILSCLTICTVSNLILCLHQTRYSYRGNAVTSKPQYSICSLFSQPTTKPHQ